MLDRADAPAAAVMPRAVARRCQLFLPTLVDLAEATMTGAHALYLTAQGTERAIIKRKSPTTPVTE